LEQWEQQPKEAANAYAAFKLYHQLGPERSISRVRSEIGEGSVEGLSVKSLRWLESWSSRWSWVERARAWDAHLEAIRQQALERSVVRAEELLREAAPEMVEALLEIAGDDQQTGTARVAAAKDLLDRAKVGKPRGGDEVSAGGDVKKIIVTIFGEGFLEEKP
jgi:membrane peptidoglycan carboxypeptidase